MSYQAGDQITSTGVVYTFNGTAWTYLLDVDPGGVSTTITVTSTPVPDSEPETVIVNDQIEYDFHVLSGLATGSIYVNTAQAG